MPYFRDRRLSRMLKKVRQLRSQLIEILNVPRGYASGFDSPVALLDGHFEHPVIRYCIIMTRKTAVKFLMKMSFSAYCQKRSPMPNKAYWERKSSASSFQ